MNVKQLAFSIAILICVTVLAVLSVRNKLTYLEYSDITPTQHSMNYVTVNNSREVLLQEFVMPYDIVHGMAIQIGTFGRDNNSEWDAAIINPETKEIYGSKHFSGSQIADNSYRFIEFDRNIRLTRNTRYQIRISARRVNSDTLLAFYVSKRANEGLSLTIGNINYDGTLCVKIYGGDSDDWWMGFVLAVSIIFWGLIVRIVFICETRKIHWIHDPVVKGYIVGIVSFLLLFSFCNYRQFLDETDNMLGGWVIAHGGVLHRDYVTQHPPFAYYLCGVFALLGAKSVEQFRLLFYLLMSAIWGLLYIRHEKQFGKKMFFLPILECTVINSMSFHPSQHAGCMVLSDGIQAICFIALLLEFLKFRRDHNLNWGRAFIVSVCVWASVGSAFLSVYALAWVALAFFVVELKKCTGENFCSSQFFYRYGKLLTAFVFPPLLAIAYFSLNNSLSRAFEQFYTFNREVYCHYSGLGKNIIEPFILSFRSVFDVLKDNINETINARASTTIVVQLLVLLVTLPVLYFGLLRKKQYLNFAVFCGVLFFLGVRGNRNYHFLAAWCMAVMIITLFYDQLFK